MKKLLWIVWGVASLVLAGYYLNTVFVKEDKSKLLIGEATHGHFQIELACESCHTDPFGGTEVLQSACMNCHEQELTDAFDSHPQKKFTNPRNADLIQIIDARYCISCHTEHQEEQTRAMGVTLPDDYCFHCHVDIGEERESHKDLAFDSCASAGCHNFHDNRALYEAFLVNNANQAWLKEVATIASSNNAQINAQPKHPKFELAFSEKAQAHPDIHDDWHSSVHAEAGVTCAGCHSDDSSKNKNWIEKPGIAQCQTCHKKETEGFTSGKHGMRLADLESHSMFNSAVSPGDSNLEFLEASLNMPHSCNSCHSAHTFDRKEAAVTSCLNCHADEHSLAYKDSKHAALWQQEVQGETEENTGVSCATCHLPKIKTKTDGTTIVHVEHNQNMNLRPNEKMIRPVCMQCHSLEFSIDALADEKLIKSNFNGLPSDHIESIDWALKREQR